MSPVAKILVVLNLLLAIAFLAASATFLGQKESWKKQYNDLDAKKKEEIADLKANLEDANQRFSDQRNQTNVVQTELTELKARFEAKQEEYDAVATAQQTLLGQYERLSQTYTDLQQTVDQLNSDKTRLIDEKDSALAEKRNAVESMNNALTEQRRLEAEIRNNQDMMGEMEKQMTAMAEELEQTKLVVAAFEREVGSLPGLISPPKIEARVSGVNNDQNIVLLSVGSDDKVKVGYTFTIYRGSEYVATVVVDDVQRDVCSGYSKKELEKGMIQVGDKATTQL